jgi:hypothetical protein
VYQIFFLIFKIIKIFFFLKKNLIEKIKEGDSITNGQNKLNIFCVNSLKEIASDVLKLEFKNVFNTYQTENIKILYFIVNGIYLVQFDQDESFNIILIKNNIVIKESTKIEIVFEIPHQISQPSSFYDQDLNYYILQYSTFKRGKIIEGKGTKEKDGKKIWEGIWKNAFDIFFFNI